MSLRTQAGTGRHGDGIILCKSRRSGACPCCNNAPRPILIFVAAKKNSSACRPPLRRGCSDVPRPILIFVAAKGNGFACGRSLSQKTGTGCHGGGIILNKKPPEGRLSPPFLVVGLRIYSPCRFTWPVSDSNLRRRIEE